MKFEVEKKVIESYSTKGGGGMRGHRHTAVVAADDEAREVCKAFDGQKFQARAKVVRCLDGMRVFHQSGFRFKECSALVKVEGLDPLLKVSRSVPHRLPVPFSGQPADDPRAFEEGAEINVVVGIIGSRLHAAFGKKEGLEMWETLVSLNS